MVHTFQFLLAYCFQLLGELLSKKPLENYAEQKHVSSVDQTTQWNT